MKEQLNLIIQNLSDSFDGQPWYGPSLNKKLQEIPWEIVNDATYNGKSIAILVQHMYNWRLFVLKKLAGDEAYNIVIDGENDWDAVHISSSEAWISLKHKLQESQEQLLQSLETQIDDLLLKKVPGKDYKFGPILTSIAQHDIYHLGQIAMLNAMLKP